MKNAPILIAGLAAGLVLASCQSTRTRESSSTYGSGGAGASSTTKTSTPSNASSSGGGSQLAGKSGVQRLSMAFPTGNKSTSAVMIEKFIPAEVGIGQAFDYEIKVTNLTSRDLTGVQVTDHIPAALKVSKSTPMMRNANPKEASWSLAKLAPNESKVIRLTGTATGEGALEMCTGVSYDNMLCASIDVTRASLKVAVDTRGVKEALLCEDIPIDFVVTNPGNGTARNVKVTSALPAGLTTRDGKSSVSFDAGTLEPGKSRKFSVVTRAKKTGSYAPKANALAANGLKADASTTAVTVREPVLKVAITGPAKQFIGRTHRYQATVTNTGNGVARKAQVEAALPTQFTFQSATEGGKLQAGRVVWNVGELAPNATKKFDLVVKSKAAGSATTKVTAKGYCAAEASATVNTSLTGIPAILIEVIDIEDPVLVGENETYVIKVTNQGSAPDRDIAITCTLDAGMDYVSSTGPTTGKASGNTVTFAPLASLEAKDSKSWKVVVRNNKEGDHRFKVSMKTRELGARPVEETEATNSYR